MLGRVCCNVSRRLRTFLGWIVEGIKLTIVPSALKDMDLPGATENVSGLSATSDYQYFFAVKIGMRPEIQEKVYNCL